ncbi:MAG: hypothetical protein IPL52_11445 [Flavobacteriales bacterium]|nr:hypothetical protein [Flavobacteriales bacterium]
MSLVWVFGQGYVGIEYWEWAVGTVYLVFLYVFFARIKNVNIKRSPEYRHFIWGLWAKVFGGVAFGLIYFYYYEGGDTLMYFFSAVAMSKMATLMDFPSYLEVLFGPNDMAHLNMFNDRTGWPFAYMYYDSRAYFVIRLISPIVIATFNSYLITTIILSSISYFGVWRCYRTFVSYFPSLTNQFAIAFLYMPSVVFWGSGIMKDTFTISATCWWVHCLDELFFKRRRFVFNSLGLVASAFLLIMMKPYIFMALFPVSVAWLLYFQVSRLRSVLVKFVLVPLVVVLILGASIYVLENLGDKLDKFSLDKMITTIQVTQSDMVRVDAYGANRFDVGEIDGTMGNLLSKFPIATNAALFRPYLWEARSVVMLLSALENFWLLAFTVLLLLRTQVRYFFSALLGNPIVLMCFMFSLLFGFFIGLSTPNFGALVRFKIPLVPLFVSGLYIVGMLNKRRLLAVNSGRRFDLHAYRKGEPGSFASTGIQPGTAAEVRHKRPMRAKTTKGYAPGTGT